MARMRVMHTMLLSDDEDETVQNYERKQTDDDLTDAFAIANSRRVNVPVSTEIGIPLAGITTAKMLYIETDSEIRLRFNGDDFEFIVKPQDAVTVGSVTKSLPGRFYVWTDSVTSLHIRNPSAEDVAAVVIAIGGS